MKYPSIREEELKNKIAQDYFWTYDCTKIIGDIDFCVCRLQSEQEEHEPESLLWAEAKRERSNIEHSIVQLILTIGKARTFDQFLPPSFFGALDGEKIAFVPYNEMQDIFYLNDFNWKVAPSNHDTKEFRLVLEKVTATLRRKTLLFDYEKDGKELKRFIKNNFAVGKFGLTKTRIDKNNFVVIYTKWLQAVKPTIAVHWGLAKKKNLMDGDFYLADLLSQDNITLKEKLFVLLKESYYELDKHLDDVGIFTSSKASFTDKQAAHRQFWNKYERPPKEEYWDYIVERRELLVPQDIRERKGSFFTPQQWVELSQQYLADALGEDWQEEYYVWDCAAGTGNLLHGLTNKYNIWASTLDKQDVSVMHDRISNGANLLESHVFQFDFLNDDFNKLPEGLQAIINDPKKRKRLLIYINPPYAEATTASTVTGTGENKAGVAKSHRYREYYRAKINSAANEVFALFMARIYEQIPDCFLAQFSTLKFVQGSNFIKFRSFFLAQYLKGFIVRANTFDNVKGSFPIGFTIWDLSKKEKMGVVSCDIMEDKDKKSGEKDFHGDLTESINKWMVCSQSKRENHIGLLSNYPPDFQNQNKVFIQLLRMARSCPIKIVASNLFSLCVYFSVRHCIKATWLNDRDQFLAPNDQWEKDHEFQNDCLAFTLFHTQNRISSHEGANHWIPFTEQEVDAQDKFESDFMTRFIKGKLKPNGNGHLFDKQTHRTHPLVFSPAAMAVFEAGKVLFIYYHQQPKCNVNASLYDIRAHFQGRNQKGKMNAASGDQTYTKLIGTLREKLSLLAQQIEPKVYVYGFLKK